MVDNHHHHQPQPQLVQEHETHLAVLAGKVTTSTTMPAINTVTRASLRCYSASFMCKPFRQVDNQNHDHPYYKVEVYHEGMLINIMFGRLSPI